jgi:hypothetical protein
MLIHYFTLEALADLWNEGWAGSILSEVYSQAKDEITLILLREDSPSTFRISVAPAIRFIYRTDGRSKARSKTISSFVRPIRYRMAARSDRGVHRLFPDRRWRIRDRERGGVMGEVDEQSAFVPFDELPEPVLDASPFSHVPAIPAEALTWTPLGVLEPGGLMGARICTGARKKVWLC